MHSCPALSLSTEGGPTLIGMFKPSTCMCPRVHTVWSVSSAWSVGGVPIRGGGLQQVACRLPKVTRHRHSRRSTPNKVCNRHINMSKHQVVFQHVDHETRNKHVSFRAKRQHTNAWQRQASHKPTHHHRCSDGTCSNRLKMNISVSTIWTQAG